MQPQYVTLVGTTPKQISLNNNCHVFNVAIRLAAGVTIQVAVEDPTDSTQPNTYTPAVTTQTPVWQTAPAAVNGVVNLTVPVSAILLTPTSGGICTILQQGIQ